MGFFERAIFFGGAKDPQYTTGTNQPRTGMFSIGAIALSKHHYRAGLGLICGRLAGKRLLPLSGVSGSKLTIVITTHSTKTAPHQPSRNSSNFLLDRLIYLNLLHCLRL